MLRLTPSHVSFSQSETNLDESMLLCHSLERTSVSPGTGARTRLRIRSHSWRAFRGPGGQGGHPGGARLSLAPAISGGAEGDAAVAYILVLARPLGVRQGDGTR